MTQQTTKLKQFKARKKVTSILSNSKFVKRAKTNTKVDYLKIIKMYFEIAIENALNGYSHDFPNDLGSLEINKRHIANTKSRNIVSKHKHHPRHIFRYELKSDFLTKFGMKFKAGIPATNKLNLRLEDSTVDYKLRNGCG